MTMVRESSNIAMTSVVALYEALTTAPDERSRARVIAEAFERLEDRYPHLSELATQAHVRETELRLQKGDRASPRRARSRSRTRPSRLDVENRTTARRRRPHQDRPAEMARAARVRPGRRHRRLGQAALTPCQPPRSTTKGAQDFNDSLKFETHPARSEGSSSARARGSDADLTTPRPWPLPVYVYLYNVGSDCDPGLGRIGGAGRPRSPGDPGLLPTAHRTR